MTLNRERITLNPIEDSSSNDPFELSGDRYGHGVFVLPGGGEWGPASETPHVAQSVDTEGGQPVATTIGLREAPNLHVQIIEPPDPAGTNFATNPQLAIGTTGYAQNAATGALTRELVRDLIGFDYALLQQNPGTNTNEGVQFVTVVPTQSVAYTIGVWLKGVTGTETVRFIMSGNLGPTISLTTSWQFYTFSTVIGATNSITAAVLVLATGSAPQYYATGFGIITGTSFSEYFDGTYPGCAWTGAPHASTSTRPATGGPRRDAIMAELEGDIVAISRTRKGTLRRTMPNGHVLTFDLVHATLTWDETSMLSAGVAKGTIQFTAEPYARSPELTTILDSFGANRPQDYTVDAGAWSNITVSGNQANGALNLATENRYIHTASQYDFYAGEVQDKAIPQATINGFKGGVILKRIDVANYLEAYVTDNGTNSFLKLDKVVNNVRTNLQQTTLAARIVAGTAFWVRARLQENKVFLEYFIQAGTPGATVVPTSAPAAVTLSAAEATVFGILTPGRAGIVFTPQTANAAVDEFQVSPYLFRERTNAALEFNITGVPGSAPALGRMDIEDDQGQNQYWLTWGQNQDNFPNAASDTYFIQAESLTLVGSSVLDGGANPGASGNNSVKNTAILTTPSQMLTTGALAHVGDFEVYARVFAPTTTSFALDWTTGDFVQHTTNDYAAPVANNGWALVDLGQIRIPTATTGPQQWQGRILAQSSAGTATGYVDCLVLVPVTVGAAKVQGVSQASAPGVVVEHDEFNQSVNGVLNAQTMSDGVHTWATSGGAGDYSVFPTVTISGDVYTPNVASRTQTNDATGRTALASAASQTNTTAQVNIGSSGGTLPSLYRLGMLLRWVDASNYIEVSLSGLGASGVIVNIRTTIATVTTVVTTAGMSEDSGFLFPAFTPQAFTPYTLKASVDTTGAVSVWYYATGSTPGSAVATATIAAAATGGALQTGKVAIFDFSGSTARTRLYDNFLVTSDATPTDAVVFSGRQLEIRSDRAQRQDSAGTIWTPPSKYEGDYLRVPVADSVYNAAHFIIKSSRNDPLIGGQDSGIDDLAAQVNLTPRWSSVPGV